jgi:hypothetical protein
MAVCGYCQCTLVRHDVNIEDIGKMAALVRRRQPDPPWHGRPLPRGAPSASSARIQQQYAAGYWNEWYLLFDDQREGWLSEGSGQFYLTFAADNPEIIPPFSQIKVGMNLKLGGQFLTVTNLENARCVAGEGELPFQVGPGFEAPASRPAQRQNLCQHRLQRPAAALVSGRGGRAAEPEAGSGPAQRQWSRPRSST